MIAGALSATAIALILARRSTLEQQHQQAPSAVHNQQQRQQQQEAAEEEYQPEHEHSPLIFEQQQQQQPQQKEQEQQQAPEDDALLDNLLDDLLNNNSNINNNSVENISPTTVPSNLHYVKQFYDVEPEYSAECECQYGFRREGFKQDSVLGRVGYHDKHLFVLTKKQTSEWSADFGKDGFPAELKKALKSVSSSVRCNVSVAEAVDGEDAGDEDKGVYTVLVMPDMVQYRGVTSETLEQVANHLLKGEVSGGGGGEGVKSEAAPGVHIFICCHGSKDMRCGVCGPQLYKALAEQIPLSGYDEHVSIRRCNHIGGHKFAGNLIIYKYSPGNRKVFGDWYGYVDLSDVDRLIQQHLIGGRIVKDIWRGRAGMKNDLAEKFLQFQ